MRINDVYREICDNPYDDAPRLRFADLIEPSEPTWAAFIRRQIDAARRLRLGDVGTTFYAPEESDRWAATLLPLVAYGSSQSVEFHRGFPTRVRMHPDMFAEYGEQLFRLAPIRHVDFVPLYDEDNKSIRDAKGNRVEFPLERVLASPALARLESIGLVNLRLPRDWARQIVACPYLDSCLYLSLHDSLHWLEDIVTLLESPAIRKMIYLVSDEVGGPGSTKLGLTSERTHGQGGPETTTYHYSERTKELERQYGYIPWLHADGMYRLDLPWYVQNGKLPKFPAGSLPPKDEWYELPAPIHHRPTW